MVAMSTSEAPAEAQRRLPWRRWEWWHRRTTTTRRVVRTSLALAVSLLVAVVLGLFTASADSSLGPHQAHYSVTPQHQIVIDLGPLGSVLMDSPLPWPIGVDVVVEEIPMELTAVPASPVTGLAGDFAAYAQVASQPDAAISEAAMMLVRDGIGRTVVILSFLMVGIAIGRFTSRGLLRRGLAVAARRPGVVPLTAVVVLALVALPVGAAVRDRPPAGTTIAALEGTALSELRMTGRMAQLIDTYGGYLVDAFEENEAFYGDVRANLETAYAENRAPVRPPSIPIVSPAPVDPLAEDDDAAADDDDTSADAAVPDGAVPDGAVLDAAVPDDERTIVEPSEPATEQAQTQEPAAAVAALEAPPRREPVTLLLVSDLHCNVGMAPVIADAARLSGAAAVLDAGDTVMSGTSVESYCVNAFAGALPEELPLVVSTGNHDSVVTARQMADAGYLVLDGSPVDVAGVRILGDTDPTLTAIGEGTRAERDETIPELGHRIAERACEAAAADEPIDILLIHNPRAAQETLEAGCAPLTLSGHWHRRVGPEVDGLGVRLVSSSTAGASGGLTVGPLNGTAELTVLRYDIGRGEPMDYRQITIGTDASVELGRWYSFPTPVPEPDPVVTDPEPATPLGEDDGTVPTPSGEDDDGTSTPSSGTDDETPTPLPGESDDDAGAAATSSTPPTRNNGDRGVARTVRRRP